MFHAKYLSTSPCGFREEDFFSSPEHKVLKVSYCDGELSVVHRPSVRPSVRASVRPCVRASSTFHSNDFFSNTT